MELSSALVAVGGNSSDDDVLKLACGLLKSPKCKLHLLYVIEMERGLPVDAEVAPATAKGEDVLKRTEQIARRLKFEPQAELLQARQAGPAVVKEALDRQVDAIVMGTPYRERYGSFYMGQTIPYVLEHAPCRVILWRESPLTREAASGPIG